MNTELIEYAEEVRRLVGRALSRLTFGHTEEASALLSEIGQKSADIVCQAQMQEEVSDVERYDLATLPAPSIRPDAEEG